MQPVGGIGKAHAYCQSPAREKLCRLIMVRQQVLAGRLFEVDEVSNGTK